MFVSVELINPVLATHILLFLPGRLCRGKAGDQSQPQKMKFPSPEIVNCANLNFHKLKHYFQKNRQGIVYEDIHSLLINF